jgi:hypothetical protein
MDLDALVASGILMGLAAGSWLAPHLSGWEWACLVGAALIGLPPFYQWFRGTRR